CWTSSVERSPSNARRPTSNQSETATHPARSRAVSALHAPARETARRHRGAASPSYFPVFRHSPAGLLFLRLVRLGELLVPGVLQVLQVLVDLQGVVRLAGLDGRVQLVHLGD